MVVVVVVEVPEHNLGLLTRSQNVTHFNVAPALKKCKILIAFHKSGVISN